LITGNKYQREEDMAALPEVLGLEIVRHYNSAYSIPGTPNGLVGRGWKLFYETALFAIDNSIQIVLADGTRLMFGRDPLNRALCQPADPANGTVTIRRTPRDGDEYLWHRTDGTAYMFDSASATTRWRAKSLRPSSMTSTCRSARRRHSAIITAGRWRSANALIGMAQRDRRGHWCGMNTRPVHC
jgi:hypothetical protein